MINRRKERTQEKHGRPDPDLLSGLGTYTGKDGMDARAVFGW
jgi:hypothetical protein